MAVDGNSGIRTVFGFQFKKWKHDFLRQALPHLHFEFAPMYLSAEEFGREWEPKIKACESPAIFLWGIDRWGFYTQLAADLQMPIFFIEDGFIRSANPHASQAIPLSLTIDDVAPHFDWKRRTRLQRILSDYNFRTDEALLSRARAGIARLCENEISKYNGGVYRELPTYLNSSRKKVLVVGQVENDAAVMYGSKVAHTNNELVRLAAKENPEAEIIYRIHPDIIFRVREARSRPEDVAHLCHIMAENIPISKVLQCVDHVYTITSLVGFEALIREKLVTVLGRPFYAGWGLTDDRQEGSERPRKLGLIELFAGAYLLYPRYFSRNGSPIEFEDALHLLESDLQGRTSETWKDPRPHIFSVAEWGLRSPLGLLGWRYLLRFILDPYIKKVASAEDLVEFRRDPGLFFAELQSSRLRQIGRLLFPPER
ncbi:capsular polysaccharide biosynthesis protein [Rhizobium deserti]|uniref:Capsular polysaccharide biosynthesis protein n=1 Tax=Rhizobium deserti TaxID=2547961 RepID=A0A4R5UIF3_9HYPH|nr:capsular polysaccharide biosynthesis protein [Rhizobium deserti]TDK36608.1 capsular polysaccharide biosynthesis protein [Rhizobium deserti]